MIISLPKYVPLDHCQSMSPFCSLFKIFSVAMHNDKYTVVLNNEKEVNTFHQVSKPAVFSVS